MSYGFDSMLLLCIENFILLTHILISFSSSFKTFSLNQVDLLIIMQKRKMQ